MSVNVPDFDYDTYEANQRRIPQEELDKYAGQCVAYSWDGARILASGASGPEVEAKLVAAGVDPSRVVHGYVDPPDAVYL